MLYHARMGGAEQVFISHSSSDTRIADALRRLLIEAGIGARRIFYTSAHGTGVEAGHDFVREIANALTTSSLAIPIITPAFLSSTFCAYELGAIWGGGLNSFPLLVPPVTAKDLHGVLTGIHVERLDQPGALDTLLDRLPLTSETRCSTAAWGEAKTRFLNDIAPALARLQAQPQASPEGVAPSLPENLPEPIRSAVRGIYAELVAYKRDLKYALDVLDVSPSNMTARLQLSFTLVSLSDRTQRVPLTFTPGRPARNYRGRVGEAEIDTSHPDVRIGRGLALSARLEPEVALPVAFSADVTWGIPDSNHFSTYMPSIDFELALNYPENALTFVVVPLTPDMVPPRRSLGRELYRFERSALPYQGFMVFWQHRDERAM